MNAARSIAILLFEDVNAIDVTGPIEVFATARDSNGHCPYKIESWAIGAVTVQTESGLKLCADRRVPLEPSADILLIPGGRGIRDSSTLRLLSDWLQSHQNKFSRIASVCTGAYALAEAGLLDGCDVVTHWAYAADLQKRYPSVCVKEDSLFLNQGRICSSGGVTSGIDLALDLVQRDISEKAAMDVAREMVVFLKRPGAQTQFSLPLKMQTTNSERLSEVCRWAASNLDADLSVEALAGRAGLSSRQFARRFRAAFGVPPATYIKHVRLDAGRTLLGQGVSISKSAYAVGFASADGFRRAFEKRFGVFPSAYQKHFREGRS